MSSRLSRPVDHEGFHSGCRTSGVLLHVTSLPSPYGIGDLGKSSRTWIDRLHEAAQSWWQVLPLGPTGCGNSPYQPTSSFAIDWNLMSPEDLIADGLLRECEVTDCSFSKTTVDYDAVTASKKQLLQTVSSHFTARASREWQLAFEHFKSEHSAWLDDYALFTALHARHRSASYLEWPSELVRLDHFRGFAAAWHVPGCATTARRGQWTAGPGADVFRALQNELGALPFIAEDLGLITPDVNELRDEFQLAGTRVLQFAFDGNVDNPYLPQNFIPNTVAYTATHDNNTTHGWFDELPDHSRSTVCKLLNRDTLTGDEAAVELIRAAWSSVAALAIVPLQDVLNLPTASRMNTPGVAEGNWRWRCTNEMMTSPAFQWLGELTRATKRGQGNTAAIPQNRTLEPCKKRDANGIRNPVTFR